MDATVWSLEAAPSYLACFKRVKTPVVEGPALRKMTVPAEDLQSVLQAIFAAVRESKSGRGKIELN
jgi:hypothetical protein